MATAFMSCVINHSRLIYVSVCKVHRKFKSGGGSERVSLVLGGSRLTRPRPYTFPEKKAGGIPLLFPTLHLGCFFSLHRGM